MRPSPRRVTTRSEARARGVELRPDPETRTGAQTSANSNARASRKAARPKREDDEPEEKTKGLRKWLCENYLKPHPTREQKASLASQNDMDPKQVSDWFTNARARMWKPSVERLTDDIIDASESD